MLAYGRKMAVFGAAFSCVVGCVLSIASSAALASLPLPDGRAWEMVSPMDKHGGEINGIDGATPNEGLPEGGVVQASTDGNAITYLSLLAFPGSNGKEPLAAPLASQYLSTRGANWSTENITTPMNSKTYPAAGNGAPYRAFSSDLSQGLMLGGSVRPVENPPLTADAPPHYMNYYLRDSQTGDFSALLTSTPPETAEAFRLELLGITPDIKHPVFGTKAALNPEAANQSEGNLYEWSNGEFESINTPPGAVHPNETSGGGAELGSRENEDRTISDDGARVFWSQPGTRSLFVHENDGVNPPGSTQMDKSQGGVDPSGRGKFETASVDGSRAFFADELRLTPNSTADDVFSHQDLYMFDVTTHQLTDLTVDGNNIYGAAVLGVLGANDDGAYLYFVAEGALPGTGAIVGHDNLYMWHEGSIRFLYALTARDNKGGANLEPTVAHDWESSAGLRTARVSADGKHLLFMSAVSLTGYDNRDANTGLPDEEVYLYDADANQVTCVSCNPSGARPTGPSGFPGGTPWRLVPEVGTYKSRVLSEDSTRVFFDSKDGLVPQDTNGVQDVYEWEQDGTGSCQQQAGCINLLSGATSTSDSSFVDASANGDDAFFVTRAELVPQDIDQLGDLYDARVGGGFAAPPAASPACESEACLPQASAPSSLGSLASATFAGMGNIAPTSTSTPKIKAKKKPAKKAKKRASKRKKKKRKANTRRVRAADTGAHR